MPDDDRHLLGIALAVGVLVLFWAIRHRRTVRFWRGMVQAYGRQGLPSISRYDYLEMVRQMEWEKDNLHSLIRQQRAQIEQMEREALYVGLRGRGIADYGLTVGVTREKLRHMRSDSGAVSEIADRMYREIIAAIGP